MKPIDSDLLDAWLDCLRVSWQGEETTDATLLEILRRLDARPGVAEPRQEWLDGDESAREGLRYPLRKVLQELHEEGSLPAAEPATTANEFAGESYIASGPGAVASRNAAFGTVHGDVHLHGSSADSDDDPDPLRSYLRGLMDRTREMPLERLDPECRSDPSASVQIEAVYTALLTSESEMRKLSPEDAQGPEGPRHRSALELLDAESRLVLLGDPGGGKSTFVNFVARCLAGERLGDPRVNLSLLTEPVPQDDGEPEDERQPWSHGALFPLRVILRDFAASGLGDGTGEGFRAFLEKSLTRAGRSGLADAVCAALQKEPSLVLLDGLDEVDVDLRRSLVESALEYLAGSDARVLISSRIHPFLAQTWQPKGFYQARLAPFTEGQIRRYARLWYDNVAAQRPHRFPGDSARERGRQFLGTILRSSRLRKLAQRPILLTLMIALDAFSRLPEKRHELYEESVELLLDAWDRDRLEGESAPPTLTAWIQADPKQIRRAFEELAFEVHRAQQGDLSGAADIPAKDLRDCLSRLVETKRNVDWGQLMGYLKERLGLLMRRDDDVYAFLHRSFQEYLAACHLSKRDRKRLVELTREDPDRWREPARLAGARMDEIDAWGFVQRLSKPTADPPSTQDHWSALIAGEVLVESAVSPLTELEPSSIENGILVDLRDRLLRVLKSDLPDLERNGAAVSLGRLGDPRFDPEHAFLPLGNLGFVRIPAGPFLFGSDPAKDPHALDREQPQSTVELEEFWTARWPVTVAQFRAYVESSGHAPGDPDALNDGEAQMPVGWVSHGEAEAYCLWLTERIKEWIQSGHKVLPEALCRRVASGAWGARLPTEQEWEKAARGEDGRIYPWGNAYEEGLANNWNSDVEGRSVVGIFESRPDASVYGCWEMVGNVFEWTDSPWTDSHSEPFRRKDYANSSRVFRGGFFDLDPQRVRCAYRRYYPPGLRFSRIGFRVVLAPFSGL